MAGKYTETFDVHEYTRVTVEVDGAESEETAQALIQTYADFEPGFYRHGDVDVLVEAEVQDSETESNEDGEWEPYDDDETDEDY